MFLDNFFFSILNHLYALNWIKSTFLVFKLRLLWIESFIHKIAQSVHYLLGVESFTIKIFLN